MKQQMTLTKLVSIRSTNLIPFVFVVLGYHIY